MPSSNKVSDNRRQINNAPNNTEPERSMIAQCGDLFKNSYIIKRISSLCTKSENPISNGTIVVPISSIGNVSSELILTVSSLKDDIISHEADKIPENVDYKSAANGRVTSRSKSLPCVANRQQQPNMDNNGIIGDPAPHRGFNAKARNVLVGPDDYPFSRGMPNKSSSEFDLRKKLNVLNSRKKDSNGSSPKSQSSVNSIPEHAIAFDTIGEASLIKKKKHMKLSEIGKAHSCAELKSDKRLLRTFAEDNIIKMPSMDSDIGSPKASELDELCLSFEGIGKSMLYSQPNDNNSNDVKEKKKEKK